jgi:hypothetical protein
VHLKAQSKHRTYIACRMPIETLNERTRNENAFRLAHICPVLRLRVIKFATKLLLQREKRALALALLQHSLCDSHQHAP